MKHILWNKDDDTELLLRNGRPEKGLKLFYHPGQSLMVLTIINLLTYCEQDLNPLRICVQDLLYELMQSCQPATPQRERWLKNSNAIIT